MSKLGGVISYYHVLTQEYEIVSVEYGSVDRRKWSEQETMLQPSMKYRTGEAQRAQTGSWSGRNCRRTGDLRLLLRNHV